jgi:hypothetical protein
MQDSRDNIESLRVMIIDIATRRTLLTLDRKPLKAVDSGEARLKHVVWTLPEWPRPEVCWLSNGREFVIVADRLTPKDGPGAVDESFIAIMNTKGQVRAAIVASSDDCELQRMVVNPSGTRVACQFRDWVGTADISLVVWDTQNLTTTTVGTEKDVNYTRLVGWAQGGDGLYLTTREYWESNKLTVLNLADKSRKLIDVTKPVEWNSPDHEFAVEQAGQGFTIRSQSSNQIVRKVTTQCAAFSAWVPNSRIFTYLTTSEVEDETRKRSDTMGHLWLSTLENNKMNHMLVADNVDEVPSWSRDLTAAGYTSRGQAYVALLSWREMDIDGKIKMGLPLTEQEMKDRLNLNARKVAMAINMYAADWEGCYPSEEGFKDKVHPYLPNRDALLLPGSDKMVFKYYPQTREEDIYDPSATIIGEMDAGYSWTVQVFADGHVDCLTKGSTSK